MKETNFDRTNFISCMNAYTTAINEYNELVDTMQFQGDTWYIAEYCCTNIRELGFGDVQYDKDGNFDIIFRSYNLENWFGNVDWSKKENREALSNFIQTASFQSYGENFETIFLSFVSSNVTH